MVIDSLGDEVLQVVAKCEAESGASRMVTSTESAAVALCRSVTVRVRVMVVAESTRGATKVVDGEVASARAISSAESWVHRYDMASLSGSTALPDRRTVVPSRMVWSGPASAVAGSWRGRRRVSRGGGGCWYRRRPWR